MDKDSPAAVNDAARRLMAVEAMLKLLRPNEGGMASFHVPEILEFILEDMKAQITRGTS